MPIGGDVATGALLDGAPDAPNRTPWMTVDKWITLLTALSREMDKQVRIFSAFLHAALGSRPGAARSGFGQA